MDDKNVSEVLSDFYRDEIQVDDLKKQIGEAVSESYNENKENGEKK